MIAAFVAFGRRHRADEIAWLRDLVTRYYPEWTPDEIDALVAREAQFEQAFLDKQRERLREKLPEALREGDPEARALKVKSILDRERDYLHMRQEAMAERALNAAERMTVRRASPLGAYWKLSDAVKEHTLGCILMGEKFWPWAVLETFHPQLHHGCACKLLTLDEAIKLGYMTSAQIPDEADAIRQAKEIVRQTEHLYEALDHEEIVGFLIELQEAPYVPQRGERVYRRYPKGFARGGQFRPRRGGAPGARVISRRALRMLRRVLPDHPVPPVERQERREGRWVWIKGVRTFIPEGRRFRRSIGGRQFMSPPGSTNVYRDGELVDTPEDGPTHPDVRRGAAVATLDVHPEVGPEEHLAYAERDRFAQMAYEAQQEAIEQANDQVSAALTDTQGQIAPATVGASAYASHDALVERGFEVLGGSEGIGRTNVDYYHPETGSLLNVVYTHEGEQGRVYELNWQPGTVHPAATTAPLLTRPPRDWDEWRADGAALVGDLSQRMGTKPNFAGIYTHEQLQGFNAMHDFRGEIWLGPSNEKVVRRVLGKLERGEPLTEMDKRDYYNASESLIHETIHAAAPISQGDYTGYAEHKAYEEALTEELAHIVLDERLRAQGLTDVLKYAKSNPDDTVVAGTYPAYRSALDKLLNSAKIAPELRSEYLFERKGETVDQRFDRLAADLAAGTGMSEREAQNKVGSALSFSDEDRHFRIANFAPIVRPNLTDLDVEPGMDWQGMRLQVGTRIVVRWQEEEHEAELFGIDNGDATVRLDNGRFLHRVQPEEITSLAGAVLAPKPTTLLVGGEEIGPGDLIEYDNIADGSISQARVTRVLHSSRAEVGNPAGWVVEAVATERSKKPGELVLLTPQRVGERFAPVEAPVIPIRPEPVPDLVALPAAAAVEKPERTLENFTGIYDGFEYPVMVNGRERTLRARVDHSVLVGPDHYEIVGTITDGHLEVGSFSRQTKQGEVEHEILNMDREYHAQGFASALNAHAEAEYRRQGYTHITMSTTGAGGYAWARAGYRFDPDWYGPLAYGMDIDPGLADYEAARRVIDGYGRDTFREHAVAGGVPPELLDEFLDRFPTLEQLQRGEVEPDYHFHTEFDIAAFGRDYTWMGAPRQEFFPAPEQKLWLGKLMMLGSMWQGRKDLVPTAVPVPLAIAAVEKPVYYHGTTADLKPGDMIEPRSTIGTPAYVPDASHYSPDSTYLTTEDHLAERYAVGRAGRQGGAPRIYEVEPLGPVAPDPEYVASGFGSDQVIAPRARVVREVPLPGVVHWDSQKQTMMRGPKPLGPLDGLNVSFSTVGGSTAMPQTLYYMNVDTPDGRRVGMVNYQRYPDGIHIHGVAVEPGQQGKGIAQAMVRELHERVAVNNEPVIHGSFSTPQGVRFGFRMAALHPDWNKLWLDYDSDGEPIYWTPGERIEFDADPEGRENPATFAPIRFGDYRFVQQMIDEGMRPRPAVPPRGAEVEKPEGLTSPSEHVTLPKAGKLRRSGESAMASVDALLDVPPLDGPIPARATVGKNKRGGYIRRSPEGAPEAPTWEGPTVRMTGFGPGQSNRPAMRADELSAGDTIQLSAGSTAEVVSTERITKEIGFGRPPVDRVRVEFDRGDEWTTYRYQTVEYKPDELVAFVWEPSAEFVPELQPLLPHEIRVSAADDELTHSAEATLVHEFGHYIDNQAFRRYPLNRGMASMHAHVNSLSPEMQDAMVEDMRERRPELLDTWLAFREDAPLRDWYQEVTNTPEYQALRTASASTMATHKYLLSPSELWARSFTQWVATRSDNPALKEWLTAWQNLPEKETRETENWRGEKRTYEVDTPAYMRHRQWQPENFERVGEALDKLFDNLGWRRDGEVERRAERDTVDRPGWETVARSRRGAGVGVAALAADLERARTAGGIAGAAVEKPDDSDLGLETPSDPSSHHVLYSERMMRANEIKPVRVEVTGWNTDNEAVEWTGYGGTEDEAVADALEKGGIIEIGDVRVIPSGAPSGMGVEKPDEVGEVPAEVIRAFDLRRELDDLQHRVYDRREGPQTEDLDALEAVRERLAAAEEAVGGTVYRLRDDQLAEGERRMGRLVKAAEKLGITPPKLKRVGEEYREITAGDNKGDQYRLSYVVVEGEEPKLGGWEFVATLQHLDELNVIRRVPGVDESVNLDKYRTGDPVCDYCKTTRDRKDTFIVRNVGAPDERDLGTSEGDTLQIGRNCLRDFLGHGDPEKIANFLEYWRDTVGDFDLDDEDGFADGFGGRTYVATEDYLTHVATMIRNEGWSPRSGADRPTSDAALDNRYNYLRQNRDRSGRPMWIDPSDKDEQEAKDALAWAREHLGAKVHQSQNATEFEHNMYAMAKSDVVEERGYGILAYLPVMHARELEREIALKERQRKDAESNYIGNVGDRMEIEAVVTNVFPRDSNYGVTYITKLRDADGNVLTWFGSYEIDRGAHVRATWTIKNHEEFRGVKQTTVNRPADLVTWAEGEEPPKPQVKPTKVGQREPVTVEYNGQNFEGEIEKAQRGFHLYLDGEKVGEASTWKRAQQDLGYAAWRQEVDQAARERLMQDMPEGATVKRGVYNKLAIGAMEYRPERYVQPGDAVAIRPKRSGDWTSDPERKWVIARPPEDNADPELVFAKVEVLAQQDPESNLGRRQQEGEAFLRAIAPDGEEVSMPESDVIVRPSISGAGVEKPDEIRLTPTAVTQGRAYRGVAGSSGKTRHYRTPDNFEITVSQGRKQGVFSWMTDRVDRSFEPNYDHDLRNFKARKEGDGWLLTEEGWKDKWGVNEWLTDELPVRTTREAEQKVLAAVASERRIHDPLPSVSIAGELPTGMGVEKPEKWSRIEDEEGYERGSARIFDNGGGLGPARGGGRWAVEIDGKWISNEDTLVQAKAKADEMQGLSSKPEGPGVEKPEDTPQQKMALRTNRAARKVRERFGPGTRVVVTPGAGAEPRGGAQTGTVRRHVPGTNAQGGYLVVQWDNGREGRINPSSVQRVEPQGLAAEKPDATGDPKKLISQGPGHYETGDGRGFISLDETFETECDDPHPMKLSKVDRAEFAAMDDHAKRMLSRSNYARYDALARGKKGYLCPGHSEHYYSQWTVRVDGEWTHDVYDSFSQARQVLEEELGYKLTLQRQRKPPPKFREGDRISAAGNPDERGTVTRVRPDGTMLVKWDAGGTYPTDPEHIEKGALSAEDQEALTILRDEAEGVERSLESFKEMLAGPDAEFVDRDLMAKITARGEEVKRLIAQIESKV
jgi:GNAT superfamily N-acetyltransferase